MKKVNAFDVLKEMGNRELDIRGFPLFDNLRSAQSGKGFGTIVMTVNPETVIDILKKKPLVGMLIVADKEQFKQVEKELALKKSNKEVL